jgi:hypothetical protein
MRNSGASLLSSSQTQNFITMEFDQEDMQDFINAMLEETDVFFDAWLKRVSVWGLREGLLSFNTQKQKGGAKYPALSPKYAALKKRRGKSALANLWSGALRRSLMVDIHGTGLKKKAYLGTDIVAKDRAPYPLFIQKGTSKMSARPFLPTVKVTEREGMKIANKLMVDFVNGVT